jgi:hypothetical protein
MDALLRIDGILKKTDVWSVFIFNLLTTSFQEFNQAV